MEFHEHQQSLFSRPGVGLGDRAPRMEDDRLLTGRGRYVADIRRAGAVEVAFLRSQLAHAEIKSIDCEAARALPGVIGVFTAEDLDDVAAVPDFPDPDLARPVGTFPLCRGRVRYVGAPLAAVVAVDRYVAEDAVELLYADLEPLPVLASIDDALAPDAPRLYEDWPDNRLVDVRLEEDKDEAFDRLRTVSGSYYMQRHGAVPMEPRGTVASYEEDRLTVWTSTQFPHIARTMLHYVLGIAEGDIRVVAPDVGGGFGIKAQVYPEDYVVAWLARRLERPVRWIDDRYEHMVSAAQARDVRIDLEAAVHDNGEIEALRACVYHDVGSGEVFPNGFNPDFVAVASLTGQYRIPRQQSGVIAVVTNKTPAGAYRGFGLPESCFAMERLVDRIAQELGIDRVELRRRLTIREDELPYVTATGSELDSGSHLAALESVAERGAAVLAELRAQETSADIRYGLGYATYVEGVAPTYFGTTGHWTSQDACDIRFDPDGGVTVAVGISAYGQSVSTMVATVTAHELGVPLEDVRVVMGDTDRAPYGLGAWGSRSTIVASGAIHRAAVELRAKGARIAAHLLEAAPEDIEFADGRLHVAGTPNASVSWSDIAHAALIRIHDLPDGVEPGLETKATYAPPGIQHVPREDGRMNACPTYTNASHSVVVRVDLGTGDVHVARYIVAHDCGRVLNANIVDGQIQGGVAQGIGGTLYEEFAYDDAAQPLATSFMDYLIPTASEIGPMEIVHFESPAPGLPWGAKGAGEAGIIGPAPAIATAVEDALSEFGIDEIVATPITPRSILGALRSARELGAVS
ncbi:MAG: aerobic carbon-monoxide dehydrogenase large subunit [Thermoleophilaceae bacterium]|jgi:carbon-monoxide dehydrogenase large subunit|nr:aerobic carbon-monoxide dehydrogenase large subunit [Thermoleophilaceae bacterium]